MKTLSLSAQLRSLSRRKGAKAVRKGGRIPANIYGKTAAAQNLEVVAKEFDNLVHKAHTEVILVDLNIVGDARPSRLALVQDVQHHPLTGHVLHVDFHEVKPDEKVTIRVPVESKGECVGVKAGGTLEHVLLRLRVRALPNDLPDQILVDVSALEVGKTIHLSDIPAPAGVEILGNKDITVFTCAAPLAPEAEATPGAEAGAAAAGDAKQPEMIKEKKTDEAPKADDKKGAEKKK
ncbi:MAG: 50S ribosomal protein L25 [Verrucomicrobia bacterium]|nr:MAG: 50S ribosomal protein L25 [Verrucomicrobiota bacterium]